jgi:hypothetical protein
MANSQMAIKTKPATKAISFAKRAIPVGAAAARGAED